MLIEELELRNWRALREERRLEFSPGVNLLIGPNEAGKSSVLEAITRCLLDRHTSQASELRRVRPLGSSLAPQVTLTLQCKEGRLRVEKRFLDDPMSRVSVFTGGRFELAHEGDRADAHVRRLLLAEVPRGVARQEQRGLAQALWYLQRDDGLPKAAWSQAVQRGLRELLELSLAAPEVERTGAVVESWYDETFSPSGRVAKSSERSRVEAEILRVRAEIRARGGELERASRYREELATVEDRQRENDQLLRSERAQLESLERRLEDAAELERQLAEAKSALESSERRLSELRQSWSEVITLEERIAGARDDLRHSEEQEAGLRVGVREYRRAAERHARRWEDELAPRLESLREQIAVLRSRVRLEQVELELDRLEQQYRRARELTATIARLREELATLDAPDEDVWERAKQLRERVDGLGERLRSSAVRLKVIRAGEHDIELEPSPEQDQETGEYLLTRATRLLLGGAEFEIVGGDDSATELEDLRTQLSDELASLLRRFDATNERELDERRTRRVSLERELVDLEARRAELGHAGEGEPSGRLTALRREQRTLRDRCPQAVLPGMEGWAEDRTLEELEDLERRQLELERNIAEERQLEQSAQQTSFENNEQLLLVSQRCAALRADLAALGEQLGRRLNEAGSKTGLRQSLVEIERTVAERTRVVEDLGERFQREVVEPRRELTAVQSRLRQLEAVKNSLDESGTDRMARVEEVASLGLDGRLGDLEGELRSLENRHRDLVRNSEATLLLRNLLRHHRSRQAASLVPPVSDLVNRWLGELTQSRYATLDLDDELVPRGVAEPGGGRQIPIESLSHGTHEQMVVLLRLALAVLLATDERQMVLLDDRLVNADTSRMAGLCGILQEVSESCQVLVASCRPESYGALEARRIEIASRDAERGRATSDGATKPSFPKLVEGADP